MKNYFVLYKRDIKIEKTKDYELRTFYGRLKEFGELATATRFALSNLPAMLAVKPPLTEEAKQLVKSDGYCVIAVEFLGKYHNTDYSGETESLHTWDVIRCEQSELEKTITKLSAEEQYAQGIHVEKVLVGLELDMFKAGGKK